MLDDSDTMVTCPNNPAHRVYQSRLQFHLTKCNHVATVAPSVCRFNSAHQVPAMTLEAHEKICPDRRIVEKDIVQNVKSAVHPYRAPVLPPSDESWECDDVPTYDPSKKTLGAPVLRSLQGATKSERKLHRKMERERMQMLHDDRYRAPQAAADREVALPPPPPNSAFDYSKSLRAPTSKSKTFELPMESPLVMGLGLGRGRVDGVGMGRGRGPAVDAAVGLRVEFRYLQDENEIPLSRGRGLSMRSDAQ